MVFFLLCFPKMDLVNSLFPYSFQLMMLQQTFCSPSLCTCQMTPSRFPLFCLLFFIFYNLHFHFVLCFVSVSILSNFLLKLPHFGSLVPYCHHHSLHLAKDHYQLLCPYSFLSPSCRSFGIFLTHLIP